MFQLIAPLKPFAIDDHIFDLLNLNLSIANINSYKVTWISLQFSVFVRGIWNSSLMYKNGKQKFIFSISCEKISSV